MNTNLSIKLLCATAMLGTATTICAQEDKSKDNDALNREMTLEREFDPTVQDANKVNTLPAVKEPEVTPRPIDYASFTSPADPEKQIATLPAGNIQTAIDYNRRRGYLDFAAGMHRNINGDFGYHILSTEKDKLNFYFSHRSTNGEVDLNQWDHSVDAKLNDNLGGIDYEHEFEKAILKIGAKYRYDQFNYYGYGDEVEDPGNIYLTEPGIYDQTDRDSKQVGQTISASIGIESPENAPIGYAVDLGYTNFGYKYANGAAADGPTENTFELGFNLFQDLWSGQSVGIAGLFEYFNYSVPEETRTPGTHQSNGDIFYSYEFKNHAEGTINPYYRVGGDNWNLKIGGKFMFATGHETKLMGSPDIAFDATVANRTLLYITAGGKLYSNSMYEVSNICRYIDPTRELEPSRNWLDGVIGIRSGAARGFWFDVFAGYKITDNDLLFTPTRGSYDDGTFPVLRGTTNIDTKLFYAGANLKYKYQQWFEIGVKGVYNNWSGDYNETWDGVGGTPELNHVWGKPEFELDANLTLRPIDKLAISATYHLETGRYMKAYLKDDVKMDNINELNLRASYDFNRTIGFYAQVNNLLNQGYDIFYGYPAQGIAVMGGVSLRF